MRAAVGRRAPRIALGIVSALFVAIIAFLVIPSFVPPHIRTFTPTPAAPKRTAAGLVTDTVTVDAGDEHRWQFFDVDRGTVVTPPDTGGWDLAFRRFHMVASGGIANLGVLPFEAVTAAPDSGYEASTFGRDAANAARTRWYTYGSFSHLLLPKGEVYVLRTREGRYVKLEILSYYCPGPTPGCLTFRYAYQPSGASFVLGRRSERPVVEVHPDHP